nr:RNA-directed DNA polymerase, eukaryota [Tanacetum cinerariifolium]
MISDVMRKITRWWDLEYMEINSFEDWCQWISSIRLSVKQKHVFEGICYIVWWYTWNRRNLKIFRQEDPSMVNVYDKVVYRSFYWIRFRCKAKFSFIDWLKNPNLVLLWVWSLEGSREFSVASIRKINDDNRLSIVDTRTLCIKCVPIKVNVLAWKIKIEALPTRFNISRRCIDIDSILCPICECGVESARHVFFSCSLVKQIVRKVCSWWDVMYIDVNSYVEWFNWMNSLRLKSKSKLMIKGVFYVVWWHVWTFRNKLFFEDKKPSKAIIFDDVVSRS